MFTEPFLAAGSFSFFAASFAALPFLPGFAPAFAAGAGESSSRLITSCAWATRGEIQLAPRYPASTTNAPTTRLRNMNPLLRRARRAEVRDGHLMRREPAPKPKNPMRIDRYRSQHGGC